MSADSESGWSFSSVSPLVQGSDGHAEVSGEFLDCDEMLVGGHGVMVLLNPFHSLSAECRQPFRKPLREPSNSWSGRFPGSAEISCPVVERWLFGIRLTGFWAVWRKGGLVFFDVEVATNLASSCDPRVIEAWPAVLTPRASEALRVTRQPLFLLIDLTSTQDYSSTSHPCND